MRLLDTRPWQAGITPKQWTFLFEVNIDRDAVAFRVLCFYVYYWKK
jgi:hypothetical protein